MKDGWSVPELSHQCEAIGLSPEISEIIASCWQEKSTRMVSSLLSNTLRANQLVDMDWSFGVTASSDDCDHIGKTFIQMKLTLDEGNNKRKNVHLELTLEQFYQFLAQMESCKSYLDFVSSA